MFYLASDTQEVVRFLDLLLKVMGEYYEAPMEPAHRAYLEIVREFATSKRSKSLKCEVFTSLVVIVESRGA